MYNKCYYNRKRLNPKKAEKGLRRAAKAVKAAVKEAARTQQQEGGGDSTTRRRRRKTRTQKPLQKRS